VNDNHRQPPDAVGLAVNSIRQMSIPMGPSPELLASTRELLLNSVPSPEEVRLQERKNRMFRIARFSGFTAAAIALTAVVGWMLFQGGSSNVAFADMIEKVKAASSVQFILRHVPRKDLGEGIHKYSIQGDHFRLDYPDLPVYNADVYIVDAKAKKKLALYPSRKIAQPGTLSDDELKAITFIDQLSHLVPESAKQLADEMVDGRRTLVYEVDQLDGINFHLLKNFQGRMKFWIDPESKLPVKMVAKVSAFRGKGTPDIPYDSMLTYEKFEWNKPLDVSLFSMEIPEGYTVEDFPK
jgi:outer membrane lipoprotein-sorting protein